MTADRTPCPSWCATCHEHAAPGSVRESVHIAAEASIDTPGGSVNACAWWSGYASAPPNVFVSLPRCFGSDGGLSVAPSQADGLAALLELLATATPEQHRELAAAVRQAAAVIAGEAP